MGVLQVSWFGVVWDVGVVVRVLGSFTYSSRITFIVVELVGLSFSTGSLSWVVNLSALRL